MPKSLFSKKLLPLYLLLPILLLLTFFLFSAGSDARAFDKLTETIFKEELSGNTINLHYTLAHPEDFDIPHYAPALPCYSADARTASEKELAGYIAGLAEINGEKLNEKEQYTYTLLQRFLLHTQEGSLFPYYDEPLSPSSGMQSQLPILLAEYTFRSRQDVEDYLGLLDQTDDYFSSLITYEQEKKEAGLLQADTSLQQVRNQCYAILSKEELAAGTHFLQTTFAERMQELINKQLITEDEAAQYGATNDRLLTTVMQPAYEALADGLFLLMGDGTSEPKGLASFPQGQDYYVWLVKKNTGSSLSMKEIKALLYPQFDAEYEELRSLLLSREDAVNVWVTSLEKNSFSLLTPNEMLSDLQTRMSTDFPAFPKAETSSASLPTLSVKTVSESLQDYCAPAFYLIPPLDDTENNVIYINEKSTPAGLELYTTLAHEGYPGHLYQSVYSQLTMQQEDENPVRQLLGYGGYQEGWALYVEFISYDYAATLATEQGNADAAYAYELEKYNRSMQLCLYALLDVSIHYDGASYDQVHQVLSTFGITNPETTKNIYNYIAEEPANYLKYYLGYLEILRLKESAQETWGEAYSDLRFHSFFLDCGPSDFTTLAEELMQR
ncbi:MAG: DUF885 domain-containing protein [Lachnospiraceae bacterium]